MTKYSYTVVGFSRYKRYFLWKKELMSGKLIKCVKDGKPGSSTQRQRNANEISQFSKKPLSTKILIVTVTEITQVQHELSRIFLPEIIFFFLLHENKSAKYNIALLFAYYVHTW